MFTKPQTKPAVPRKAFTPAADCDTIYTNYLSICIICIFTDANGIEGQPVAYEEPA